MTRTSTAGTLNELIGVPSFFPGALEALRLSGAKTHGLAELTDAQWRALLAFGDLAHLTIPLVRACGDSVPGWVRLRSDQNLADNTLRVKRIAATYIEMARAFDEAGIEHLVIKGFAQYPDFVDCLEQRMQSDIDLYCPEEFIPAARSVLERLGYSADRTLKKFPADHLPEMTRKQGWQWRGNAYDPEMPPPVDLHFCFWNAAATRLSIPGVDEFWGRRIEQRRGDFHFPALSSIDNLAFCALHILRDLQRGDWVIHHVYELAWFLHSHANDDALWQAWKRYHDDSFRGLQIISFWLARQWFHCRLAETVDLELSRMPLPVREWLERFSASPLNGMFQPNKHGVWLHLALLESRWDRLRVLGSALMPFRLPAVGAPGQDATKDRRYRRWWPSQRYAKYVLHVIFRIGFHLQTLPNTLWHGFRWWLVCWNLDQRRISTRF
jgi:Uncharacterised nucleotidyltransferase